MSHSSHVQGIETLINEDSLKAYVESKIKEMVSPTTRTDQLRSTRVDRLEVTRQRLKETVESLPTELKQKAWLLVEYLDQNKLMLDATGAFIPKNQRKAIEGSKIADLMKYALRKSSKEEEPQGFPIFLQQLKSYGIGKDIISPRHFAKEKEKKKNAVPMEVEDAQPIKDTKKGTPTSV
jgi:hypothetical protein